MRNNTSILVAGFFLELAGILTLLTSEGSIAHVSEIGFSFPVLLLNANVQGLTMFAVGSIMTAYAFIQMSK